MRSHQLVVTPTVLTIIMGMYFTLLSMSITQGFIFHAHISPIFFKETYKRIERFDRATFTLLGSSAKGDNNESVSTVTASSTRKGFAKVNVNLNSSKTKNRKSLNLNEDDNLQINKPTMNVQEDTVASSSSTSKSAGKEALDKLRQADNQRRKDEFISMQQLQEIDQSLKDDPSLGVIPEKVATRMGKRMLPFVGLPLFGSMFTFVLFWYLARYKDFSIPTVLVAYATSAILVVGLMGITYSVMSASWDVDREGTFIGWEEFQKNINNIRDGLQRSRENAVLRDKLSVLSDDERKKLEKL